MLPPTMDARGWPIVGAVEQRVAPGGVGCVAIGTPHSEAARCSEVDASCGIERSPDRRQNSTQVCIFECIQKITLGALRDGEVAAKRLSNLYNVWDRQVARGVAHGALVLEKVFVGGAEADDV